MDIQNTTVQINENLWPIILDNLPLDKLLDISLANKYFYMIIVPMTFNRLKIKSKALKKFDSEIIFD